MKKSLLVIFSLLALLSCSKQDPQQPEQPEQPGGEVEEPTGFQIALSYDSLANTVTAIPSDSSEYVLQIWMKQDFILDYGDDFSEAHILESLQAYIDLCVEWEMAFPTFRGEATVDVYEFFDQPYPGEEFIAMAAQINTATGKLEGKAFYLFFRSLL